MPGSKKERKNAKEGGGNVTAAVSRHQQSSPSLTSRLSGAIAAANKTSTSTSPARPVPSLETKPFATSFNATPTTLLSALEAASVPSVSVSSTAPSMANDWLRSGLAGSPGNLVSLVSDSPPTRPSSYEDGNSNGGGIHQAWANHHHGAHASPPMTSPSPPSAIKHLSSAHTESSFRIPDQHQQSQQQQQPQHVHSPVPALRRGSMPSPFSHARSGSHPPPLPHQPQAHFYAAPSIDLGSLVPQSGMEAGEKGYMFGFDRLPRPFWEGVPGSDHVVLAGYEGGLEVYVIGKRGLDHAASLKGLRGGVVTAKILPWTVENDSAAGLFPLVAVVVHGPVLPQSSSDMAGRFAAEDASRGPAAASSAPSIVDSPPADFTLRDAPAGSGRVPAAVDSYQTTVEVYSLRRGKCLGVLLVAPKIPINTTVSLLSSMFQPPPPSGAFQIKADAGTIVISSGLTGECWIYRQSTDPQDGSPQFGCIGKVWTSVQQGPKSAAELDDERGPAARPTASSPPRTALQVPVMALNGRWLAYSPATPSSQLSLRAHVPVAVWGKAPGFATVTPPQLPPVTSSVDLPISESMVNKIMRETTQELISGAKWVGQQGMQAWNAYWNKQSGLQQQHQQQHQHQHQHQQHQQQQQQQPRSPPLVSQWGGRHDTTHFPPTHGAAADHTVPKEPRLVSIVDLETVGGSTSIHPLATFTPPLGCSFMSFSPTGLSLFTASIKGDVQTVWDLMRIQYTKWSPLQAATTYGTSAGSHVRQIAQFSRMTVARIVEVAWVRPGGERIAMVTERGTVHLLEMPPSAFAWPPSRRRKPAGEATARPTEQGTTTSAVSIASSAIGAAFGAARPLISRPRRSSANMPGLAPTTIVDSANQGGRVFAATIGSSLGKTGTAISQLRHTGENRVALPPGPAPPGPLCADWMTGRRRPTLFVVGGGIIRTYYPKPRRPGARQADKRRTSKSGKYQDFKVPLLPDGTVSAFVKSFLELGSQEEYLDLSDKETDGGLPSTLESRPRAVEADDVSAEAAVPQAEIESSAPYQPFHTDRRVSLLEFGKKTTTLQRAAATTSLGPLSLMSAKVTMGEEERATSKKKKNMILESPEVYSSPPRVWAFGQKIVAVKLDVGLSAVRDIDSDMYDDHRALPVSAMERVMHVDHHDEQLVVTTRRRRRPQPTGQDDDGFFEDDCEVLDFADQRV